MKKRNLINYVFLFMLTCSTLMIYIFFLSWNRSSSEAPGISQIPLDSFSIDSCSFDKNGITVIGWAFIKGNANILNRIYAKNNDGNWNELMSSTVARGDVSAKYLSPIMYDRSGFISTRREMSANKNYTKEIMIISLDNKGLGHAATYHCQ